MSLGIYVLVPIRLGHDIGTLQAKIQRAERYNGLAIGPLVRLGYYARFLVYGLKDVPVVVKGCFARILEHLAHMLCLHCQPCKL